MCTWTCSGTQWTISLYICFHFCSQQCNICQFNSVQCSSRWYPYTQENSYAFHPTSKMLSHCCLWVWQSSTGHLTDTGPFSSFQGRLLGTFTHYVSLPLVYSMVWCAWLCTYRQCLKFLNTSDLPRCKPLVMVALPNCLSDQSFPLTLTSQGQCIHRSLWRWCSNIATCRNGLLFRFLFFVWKPSNLREWWLKINSHF